MGCGCLLPPPAWISITPGGAGCRRHSHAPGVTVDARNFTAADVLAKIEDAGLTYPLFVKPSRAGSSFGV